MNTILEQTAARESTQLSALAKARMELTEGSPLLHSDWVRSLFIHYAVDPKVLQPVVPFELDVRDGMAYVSVVAFHMRNLRPHLGGAVAACLSRPMAQHGFLNVRTYVVHDGEPGIFFLAEWLPNALSVFIGPRTFGLPYRYGKLDYQHEHEHGCIAGEVAGRGANESMDKLNYSARVDVNTNCEPCEADSLDEFLLERYTAYTERRGVRRRFRVWHEPWRQVEADVTVHEAKLIEQTGPWFREAKLIGANYSPGVIDVHLGRPQCINGKHCERHWR